VLDPHDGDEPVSAMTLAGSSDVGLRPVPRETSRAWWTTTDARYTARVCGQAMTGREEVTSFADAPASMERRAREATGFRRRPPGMCGRVRTFVNSRSCPAKQCSAADRRLSPWRSPSHRRSSWSMREPVQEDQLAYYKLATVRSMFLYAFPPADIQSRRRLPDHS